MNIQQFLEIIDANRGLLGKPSEEFGTGCPLRVAMSVHLGCPCIDYWVWLFQGPPYKREPVNPDSERAAEYLGLNEVFTDGVVKGWDSGTFYDDAGDSLDWNFAFSGFLIGVSLRPAPLQLTSGN